MKLSEAGNIWTLCAKHHNLRASHQQLTEEDAFSSFLQIWPPGGGGRRRYAYTQVRKRESQPNEKKQFSDNCEPLFPLLSVENGIFHLFFIFGGKVVFQEKEETHRLIRWAEAGGAMTTNDLLLPLYFRVEESVDIHSNRF